MSVEEAVSARLKAATAVRALASTRVYQLKLPQKPTLPAVQVQEIDEPVNYHLRGNVDLTDARVQVDCYGLEDAAGDPYAAVMRLAEAVTNALTGAPFVTGDRSIRSVRRVSRRVMYEGEELKMLRVSQDFMVLSKTV